MSSTTFWSLLFLLFCLSGVLTWVFRRLCAQSKWMDIPNGRSAHSRPTPKGGGLVFALLFEVAITWLFFDEQITFNQYFALSLSLPMMLVGLLDDFYNLPILARLFVQAILSFSVLFLLDGFPPMPFIDMTLHLGLFGYLLGTVAVIWLINLFNFMDGMDGLAACETMFVCIAAYFFLGVDLHSVSGLLMMILLFLTAGFLLFNFPPASLFMGDAGSNFLGYILAAMAFISIAEQQLTLWTWTILLGVFIVDSTFTLLRRVRSDAVWYHAHDSHAYQKLMQKTRDQRLTLLLLMIVNVIWLLPLSWLSNRYPGYGFYVLVIAYIPLVILAYSLNAGKQSGKV